MKKNILLLSLMPLLFLSCKKDKITDEPAPIPLPLEKAIIGKWIENINPTSSANEYHFINDSTGLFIINFYQIKYICNVKYKINKDIYPNVLGWFEFQNISGQCNNQDHNLKMLEINDSTFKASYSRYTGNPPNYFEDVITKYRKFQ